MTPGEQGRIEEAVAKGAIVSAARVRGVVRTDATAVATGMAKEHGRAVRAPRTRQTMVARALLNGTKPKEGRSGAPATPRALATVANRRTRKDLGRTANEVPVQPQRSHRLPRPGGEGVAREGAEAMGLFALPLDVRWSNNSMGRERIRWQRQ